jgi:hypothetical protein
LAIDRIGETADKEIVCGTMRIVTVQTMVEDLRAHFGRAGFVTERDGKASFLVTARDGRSLQETKREVALMLRLWCAMHPGMRADAMESD